MCGEYGTIKRRPHFHAILFNLTFPDQYHWKDSNGLPIYRSPWLETKWKYGIAYIGTVTHQSIAYVARYIMQKNTGSPDDVLVDPSTGQILKPEYNKMSLINGIGYDWFNKNYNEVYPADEIIMNGHPMRPPAYYDKLYAQKFPEEFDKILANRAKIGRENSHNSTPERLIIREKVKQSKLKQLKRELE